MWKSVFLATTLVPLTAEIVATRPLAAQTTYPYPLVSHAERDTLYCYMETTDGRIVQLESLCATEPEETASGGGRTPSRQPRSTATARSRSPRATQPSSSGGSSESTPTPTLGSDGLTTCYPVGSPDCLNSQFEAPEPPMLTPSDPSESSGQGP
jgi:hypothetical protein